jgi:hypothetical protein
MYGQGMHAPSKFRRKDFVDHTVALHCACPGEGLAHRYDFKVAFGAIGHIMSMTLIQNF